MERFFLKVILYVGVVDDLKEKREFFGFKILFLLAFVDVFIIIYRVLFIELGYFTFFDFSF